MSATLEQGLVEQQLLTFLRQRTKSEWTADRDLFADSGLTSLFAMELVVYIEGAFGVVVGGPDLQLKNFRTVNAMVELVTRLGANGG